LGRVLARTTAHFFPDLPRWAAGVPDSRFQPFVEYPGPFLLWMGLLLFILRLGSRRQLGFELNTAAALDNLNRMSHCRQETLADHGTLNHYLGHVDPEDLHQLRRQMVHRLIRMRALDHARLYGHFLVVLDGTGQLYFRQRHCEHCLTKTVDGQTQYYHPVLEAKLVTPEGLAISIASEFIENSDPKATKQDCEWKAFARLSQRLKKDFPQLRMCLCLDGLYAKGPVFRTCQDNGWKYLITFKKGSLPSLWKDYLSLRRLSPANRKKQRHRGVAQSFAWVEGLEHVDDHKQAHRVNVLQCLERDGQDRTRFVWLTNFPITPDTAATLANRGARCRWKIENEGFNIQKNGGFNLEHAYSTGPTQIKNFYVLLQIAHMILQLIERGSLLSDDCRRLFGSFRNLSRRLAQSLRNHPIPPDALDPLAAASIQIRLNTS
jgi:hypothetical protein